MISNYSTFGIVIRKMDSFKKNQLKTDYFGGDK